MLQHHYPDLKLITFDLDDTLWPCHKTIMRAEEALYAWLQLQAPRLTAENTVDSMRQHRRQLALAEPEIAHDMTLLRQRHLELLLGIYGHDKALAPAGVEYFQKHRNRVEPYEDVPGVLMQLREYQSYHLVLLFGLNHQMHLMNRHHLQSYYQLK